MAVGVAVRAGGGVGVKVAVGVAVRVGVGARIMVRGQEQRMTERAAWPGSVERRPGEMGGRGGNGGRRRADEW